MFKTQAEAVLWHMQTYGSITSIEAITEYGVTRLAAVISQLRNQGYNIRSVIERGVSRYGNQNHYARYSLVEG